MRYALALTLFLFGACNRDAGTGNPGAPTGTNTSGTPIIPPTGIVDSTCANIDPGSCPPADLAQTSCPADLAVPADLTPPADLAPEADDPACTCDRPEHGLGLGHCKDQHLTNSQGHGNGHCKFDCVSP